MFANLFTIDDSNCFSCTENVIWILVVVGFVVEFDYNRFPNVCVWFVFISLTCSNSQHTRLMSIFRECCLNRIEKKKKLKKCMIMCWRKPVCYLTIIFFPSISLSLSHSLACSLFYLFALSNLFFIWFVCNFMAQSATITVMIFFQFFQTESEGKKKKSLY